MARGPRADQWLVDHGLAESRARAQALIMAGLVYCGDRQIAKSGETVAPDALLLVRGRDHPWVSRGGVKLAHGLQHFGISAAGLVCLDVGASTGGFTDVLLHHGAVRVYAVDVGTNQLAWKLRQDERVIVMERTNARSLDASLVPEPIDLIVCDASFIPLAKVLERPLAFARPGAHLVALVKPQFEAEHSEIGKKGVVRDPLVRARVVQAAGLWLEERGWILTGPAEPSPITGPEGNVEYLLGASLPASTRSEP
jgi:23S rRNA (cytidine1920-2'-O)/16S rRNA (cytidine1409-2'-O)-methyltransferase